MSWSIEEHIGEGRPWPEQVVVYRGETDESLTYARRSLSDMNKMAELMDALATENAKLRESLENAAGIITDICGECPVSRYEWLSSDGCAEKCGTVTEEECWIAYLTGKRWDESGVEVNG